MNDGLGKPSVLDGLVWTLNFPVQVYSQEEYTVKKMNMVGADYLQVTIYMQWVFIFNNLTWWLVDW